MQVACGPDQKVNKSKQQLMFHFLLLQETVLVEMTKIRKVKKTKSFGILDIFTHSFPEGASQLAMATFFYLFKDGHGYNILNLIAPDPNSKIKSQGLTLISGATFYLRGYLLSQGLGVLGRN